MSTTTTKSKAATQESLAQLVLDSVEPGYPEVPQLSPDSKRSIAQFIQDTLIGEYRGHKDKPELFEISKKGKDAIQSRITGLCGEDTHLLKEAKKYTVQKVKHWTVFIQNARLFKQAKVSAEAFSKGMVQ